MKFVSFASSSSGNVAFISYKNTNILVDCGISKRRIVENLAKHGKTLSDIDYILVTHEHDDHISGLPAILKDNNIKVMSQRETLIKIVEYCAKKGTKVNPENFKIIKPVNTENDNAYIALKDMKIYPIKGAHDVPSVFYKIVLDDTILAILTDMGTYSESTIRSIKDVNYLMLECNYDAEMLLNSNYPAFLKSRILGEKGHLSNVNSSEIIMRLDGNVTKKVFLSHISDESNNETHAIEFVNKYIKDNYKDKKILPEICVSKRLEETMII